MPSRCGSWVIENPFSDVFRGSEEGTTGMEGMCVVHGEIEGTGDRRERYGNFARTIVRDNAAKAISGLSILLA